MPTPRLTRRRLLAATGGGALGAVAGCSGVLGDDETQVTLMIERVRSDAGHSEDGHDHSHEEDDHEHSDGEDSHGGVSADALAHTCSHVEELDPFSLDASDSQDEAPAANAHEVYTVTLPGDTGYVSFEPSEAGRFGFFVADGTVTAVTGTASHEEDSVPDCDAIDRYAVIEPEDSEIVVELTGD